MTNRFQSNALWSKFVFTWLLLLLIAFNGSGQSYRKMTPDVYNEWQKIKNTKMSGSSEIIIFLTEREMGDKTLHVYQRQNEMTTSIPRVLKAEIDISGTFALYTHGLAFDSTRTLLRKKTPKDKLLKDSLTIWNVVTGDKTTIDGVLEFALPAKYTGYCFYKKKIENTVKDSTEKTDKMPKPVCDATALIIRNLYSGKEDTLLNIKDYTLAEESPVLAYTQCTGDSIPLYNLNIKYLETDSTILAISDMHQISKLCLDKKGQKIAFLALKSKSDSEQKPYDVYIKNHDNTPAQNISEKYTSRPENWLISQDRNLMWSESANRLFFGIAPKRIVRDTTKLEDEIVMVEIWHHDAPRLYTQMDVSAEEDRKKSYLVMYDMVSDYFDQLENPETEKAILSEKGDGRYVLQLKTMPYEKAMTWTGEVLKDVYLRDTKTKNSILINTGESGSPAFSPGGRFVYWWSRQDSIWKTFDTQKSTLGILGLWSITKFHDEENDVPQLAGPYGIGGWLKGDSTVLVYDRYDIWKLNPNDPFSNINITDGRLSQTVHRILDTDEENEYIDPEKIQMIHRFNEVSKSESYLSYFFDTGESRVLISGDFALTKNIRKASKADYYLFTKENFTTFPDLWIADGAFTTIKKISDVNPQQNLYGWGSATLYSWTNYKGLKNDGMLFFPPQFDPEKKYPLIVNFYERSSDDLHKHRAPEAHRSTINYTYYTNLGYVIFNPDIKYTTGQPGDDCFDAVESGVDALLKLGYIDEKRIGLQGHSWGGYQVAYLLTKSNRYACAESGAPVVNMVSAYGGIRWESGLSRMFQYEKAQSRLGASLWENTSLYHKNSPIYEMTNVNTPVLILHNDKDGAVPWYQGIEYFMALRRLGKPAWLLNYNGEPHWPVKWQNRLDFNIRMEQFFNHFLMDAPMPKWMQEGNTPLEKGIINKY